MAEERLVRASDGEREQVAARLNDACVEGRLTVDELAHRLELAYTATTRRELDTLIADLPVALVAPTRRVAKPRRPRWPGHRSFRERFVASAPREQVVNESLVGLAPRLESRGYIIVSRDAQAIVFERDRRPVWTVFVAVVVFPVGLVALLHRVHSRVALSFTDTENGVEITASGTAPLWIRRAFAELGESLRT